MVRYVSRTMESINILRVKLFFFILHFVQVQNEFEKNMNIIKGNITTLDNRISALKK